MTKDGNELCGAETTSGDPCQNYADTCPWHGEGETPDNGRPSKLKEYEDEVLEAASEGLTLEGVARVAGIGVSTLYDWMDKHDDFSEALTRARAEAERELIKDCDAQFVLERSYGYMKTEKREISGEGGGGIVIDYGSE